MREVARAVKSCLRREGAVKGSAGQLPPPSHPAPTPRRPPSPSERRWAPTPRRPAATSIALADFDGLCDCSSDTLCDALPRHGHEHAHGVFPAPLADRPPDPVLHPVLCWAGGLHRRQLRRAVAVYDGRRRGLNRPQPNGHWLRRVAPDRQRHLHGCGVGRGLVRCGQGQGISSLARFL